MIEARIAFALYLPANGAMRFGELPLGCGQGGPRSSHARPSSRVVQHEGPGLYEPGPRDY